jgi:glycosyltransferase involved in cell wall biosynthesis
MPTANRRRFVPSAIARFQARDYANAELIILDDGEDTIADLVPDDPAVRYLRAPRYRTLGHKRNEACEAANGEIILHWDDDDWYAPDRVRLQVEALLASGAELCGLDRVLFYDPRIPAAWEYVYPSGGPPWVAGATLCYRRDYWRMHPFPDLTVGEDNAFAAAARAGELQVLPDNRFFVALVHPGNTSAKNTRDPRWCPYDATQVRALTGPAWPAPDRQIVSHSAFAAPPPSIAARSAPLHV